MLKIVFLIYSKVQKVWFGVYVALEVVTWLKLKTYIVLCRKMSVYSFSFDARIIFQKSWSRDNNYWTSFVKLK